MSLIATWKTLVPRFLHVAPGVTPAPPPLLLAAGPLLSVSRFRFGVHEHVDLRFRIRVVWISGLLGHPRRQGCEAYVNLCVVQKSMSPSALSMLATEVLQGYLAHKKQPPP